MLKSPGTRSTAPRRLLALGLAVLLVVTACTGENAAALPQPAPSASGTAAAPATSAQGSSSAPAAAVIPAGSFSGQNARSHVDELAGTIGSRPAGTEPEQAAARYIAAQLERAGYRVERQGFDFSTFEDRSSLRVGGGELAEVAASLIIRSVQGTVQGALADAGLGLDLAAGSLSGRVALMERGQLTFEEKAKRAAEAGAAAAIVFNNRPGAFRGNMQNPSTIPTIGIAREDGLRLRQALDAGPVEVEVRAAGERVTQQSQNVVAYGGARCALLVGGHYDSVAQGPGANDNASGTAVMLELARALAPIAADRNLCFAAFGAEEVGLYGSRSFVERLDADQRRAMSAMINLDMVGVGDSWKLIGDPDLARTAARAAERAGIAAEVGTLPEGTGSDHQSFLDAQIPAVFLNRWDDPLFHTPMDTPDRVEVQHLQSAGTLALALVQELAEGR